MKNITDLVEFTSGSPQFRINESNDLKAPVYKFFDQNDMEFDISKNNSENKRIKTYDKLDLLKSGDVIFSLISGKSTIITKKNEGYLFTQNYVRISPNKLINKKYLVYLINEDSFIKKQFQMSLQGSMVMKYTIKQLKNLKLHKLPSLKIQELIGKIYFNQIKLSGLKKEVFELEKKVLLEKLRRENIK